MVTKANFTNLAIDQALVDFWKVTLWKYPNSSRRLILGLFTSWHHPILPKLIAKTLDLNSVF